MAAILDFSHIYTLCIITDRFTEFSMTNYIYKQGLVNKYDGLS